MTTLLEEKEFGFPETLFASDDELDADAPDALGEEDLEADLPDELVDDLSDDLGLDELEEDE
jgi:hypothetical protein